MDQSIATVVAAVVALAGVLTGVIVGAKRWRIERRDTRTADFNKERQTAYRNIWSSVETLSVAMRIDNLAADATRARIRDLNAELLKSSLYVDEADSRLATEYVAAVERLHLAVSASEEPEAKERFAETSVIPLSVIERAKELGETQEKVKTLRDALIQRIRRVLTVNE